MGNLYVADAGNNRIQEFTANGTFLTSFGLMGPGNGQLVNPQGLAVGGSGNVYVTDTGNSPGPSNNRIEIFSAASSSQSSFGVGGHGALRE
jgi:hypothetical protein